MSSHYVWLNFFSKDVRMPFQLQRAMAAEAEAIREAKAKVVSAEGELSASKSLKAASDVIASNPVALQVCKYVHMYLCFLFNTSSAVTLFTNPQPYFG